MKKILLSSLMMSSMFLGSLTSILTPVYAADTDEQTTTVNARLISGGMAAVVTSDHDFGEIEIGNGNPAPQASPITVTDKTGTGAWTATLSDRNAGSRNYSLAYTPASGTAVELTTTAKTIFTEPNSTFAPNTKQGNLALTVLPRALAVTEVHTLDWTVSPTP